MDLEDQPGFGSNRLLVIGQPRAVGRADLPESRPALCHDIRDTERAANLDQLTPGDDDIATRSQGVHREEYGRGIVVDGECCLVREEKREPSLDVRGPGTSLPGIEVVLQ